MISKARKVSAAMGSAAAVCLALLSANATAGLFDRVLGRSDSSERLPLERAFQIKVEAVDGKTVVATLVPAPNHYLYRETLGFAAKNARLGPVILPRGSKKQDPFFGETEVYTQPVQVTLALERVAGVPASVSLLVFYQGCNERLGVCYLPTQAEFPIQLP